MEVGKVTVGILIFQKVEYANTINAAIIREIGRLGDKARFTKVGRGLFTAR